MPTIAVIDDRKDSRETFVLEIELALERIDQGQAWSIISISPFLDVREYTSWIAENDISVLVIDERLYEGPAHENKTKSVTYAGHNVVDAIRKNYVKIPIWIISAYTMTDEVERRFPDVEGVVVRAEFSEEPSRYVSRFIRAGASFYEEHRSQLETIAALSLKVAKGEATEEEKAQLGGLQMSKSLEVGAFIPNAEWVEKYERAAAELEDLTRRIQMHIEGD